MVNEQIQEEARLEVVSKRSDLVADISGDGATITLLARNPLVAWIVLLAGGFASLGPLTLLAYGLSVSNYGTVFLMTALTAAVYWLTWRIGWQPRPFQIVFSRGFLEVGAQRYRYSDIQSFGLASDGGDPVSIGVPRNITIGSHIYIEVGARHLPITVELKREQANEVLRVFRRLSAYGSTSLFL